MPGFQFTAGGVGTGAGFQIGASTPNTAAGAGGLSFSSTPSTSQPLGGLSGLSGMGGLRGGGLTAPGGGLGTPTAGSTGTGGLSLTMGTPKSHFGTTPAPTQFSAPAFPVSGANTGGFSMPASKASTASTSLATSSAGMKLPGAGTQLTPAPLSSISTPKPTASGGLSTQGSFLNATSTAGSIGSSLGLPSTAASGSKPLGALGSTLNVTPVSTSLSTNTLAAATTITPEPASQKPSEPRMSYGQVEEKLNTWKREINKKVGEFKEWAGNVNAWDCKLVSNTEKIITLHEEVERVKAQQKKLDQELKVISSQQAEIAEILQPLEAKISSDEHTQVPDDAREETFQLAESVQNRLDRTCEDLKTIIKRLNDSASTDQQNSEAMDPMLQISQILGAHVDTLSWVEQRTDTLDKRVQSLENSAQAQVSHLHHQRMY